MYLRENKTRAVLLGFQSKLQFVAQEDKIPILKPLLSGSLKPILATKSIPLSGLPLVARLTIKHPPIFDGNSLLPIIEGCLNIEESRQCAHTNSQTRINKTYHIMKSVLKRLTVSMYVSMLRPTQPFFCKCCL